MVIRHQYLDSFIITVLCKDIFHAMIVKMGFMAHPKSESIYLMKFMKFCTYILDTLVKNSGRCSNPFSVNNFFKLTNFSVLLVATHNIVKLVYLKNLFPRKRRLTPSWIFHQWQLWVSRIYVEVFMNFIRYTLQLFLTSHKTHLHDSGMEMSLESTVIMKLSRYWCLITTNVPKYKTSISIIIYHSCLLQTCQHYEMKNREKIFYLGKKS